MFQLLFILIAFLPIFYSSAFQNNKTIKKQRIPSSVLNSTNNFSNDKQNDFGSLKIFLQPNQHYILTPAVLFDSSSSFKKQYKIQEAINDNLQFRDFLKVHPVLEKIKSYNLSEIMNFNYSNCKVKEMLFTIDDYAYFVCATYQNQVKVYQVSYKSIILIYNFTFNSTSGYSNLNIVTYNDLIFYNSTHMGYYVYNPANKTVQQTLIAMEQKFLLQQCQTYIEDILDETTNLLSETVFQVCYTNNNEFRSRRNGIQKKESLKKQYVILITVEFNNLKVVDSFEIITSAKEEYNISQIIGLEIIGGLQRIIMLCYNIYNSSQQSQSKGYNFIRAYCSIYKLISDQSTTILIDRMMLQQSNFPLLQVTLQIKMVLTLITSDEVIFYNVDIGKQIFQFQQKINIPQSQKFDCYEFIHIAQSCDSVSLTCAYSKDSFQNISGKGVISFLMVYDENIEKYVVVGDFFVNQTFFHTNQLIYEINPLQLLILSDNQEYITISYISSATFFKIYQVDSDNPSILTNFTNIYIIPTQKNGIYLDKVLPMVKEIYFKNQDDQDSINTIDLKNAFIGSNISYVQAQFDHKDSKNSNQSQNSKKKNRIFFYQPSYLISIYIRQKCIRVNKYIQPHFYRILEIEKSRVDDLDHNISLTQKERSTNNCQQDIKQQGFYYYTQICKNIDKSYLCELYGVNQSSSTQKSQPQLFRIESTKNQRVISIEYIPAENAFLYLYELKQFSNDNNSKKRYGLTLVSENQKQFGQYSYDISTIFERLHSCNSGDHCEEPIIKSIKLQKQFMILQNEDGQLRFYSLGFLINIIKSQHRGNDPLFLKVNSRKSIITVPKSLQGNVGIKFYIQDHTLIIMQIKILSEGLNLYRKQRTFSIYRIINDTLILKQASYFLSQQFTVDPKEEPLSSFQGYFNNTQEYVGIYKSYIIILNATTISRFHMSVQLQEIYRFVYNPFDKEEDLQRIQYVLFLDKYIIIQFELYYQLYNIGEFLINIQISVYSFSVNQQNQNKINKITKPNKLNKDNNIGLINYVVNDAFIIENDSILLYEQGKLYVAKYITNPKLQFIKPPPNHFIVEDDLDYSIIPVADTVDGMNSIYQVLQAQIFYSHFQIEKVSKAIRILTIPSFTQNYQIQIWTHVFKGPVLQYDLSDNFDDQIVLSQHIMNVTSINNMKVEPSNITILQYSIQFNKPFQNYMRLRHNHTHFIFSLSNVTVQQYISIPQQLQHELMIKFLQINNKNMVAIISNNYIIFFEHHKQGSIQKFTLLNFIPHNISTENIQIVPQYFDINNLITTSVENNNFYMTLCIKNKQIPTLYLFEGNLNLNSSKVDIKITEKALNISKILDIQINENFPNKIFILTQNQTIVIYSLLADSSPKQQQLSLKQFQIIQLKDEIIRSYRSKYYIYLEFLILSNPFNQTYPYSMLLFSSTDLSFHIEFSLKLENNLISYFSLQIVNIYAGYKTFRFKRLVAIRYFKNAQECWNKQCAAYKYFIVEYQHSLYQSVLSYYGFNYNFTKTKQVGYLKCGQTLPLHSSGQLYIINENTYSYVIRSYSIEQNQTIKIQYLNVTTSEIKSSFFKTEKQLICEKLYAINSSIYMILNYDKPPVASYILLIAKNFESTNYIYTQLLFLTQEVTWNGFFIGIGIVIIFFISFGYLLKKYQPKQSIVKQKKSRDQTQNQSRKRLLSDERQQRIICIEEANDQDESSEQSLDDQQQDRNSKSKFDYVPPNRLSSNLSSLLESPFKSYHSGKNSFPQNDFNQVPHPKSQSFKFGEQDYFQEKPRKSKDKRNASFL